MIKLNDPRMRLSESRDFFDTAVFSILAEYLHPNPLTIDSTDIPPPRGIASFLKRGMIVVNGDLDERTADGMQGGLLYVKGDVQRISNVFDGMIYIDGNIAQLMNVHHPSKIICTGTIGGHLYRLAGNTPSQHIVCGKAPDNKSSYPLDQLKWLEKGFQYKTAVQVSERLLPLDHQDIDRRKLYEAFRSRFPEQSLVTVA